MMPPHRGADQHELVEAELLGEFRQILRLIFVAVGAGRRPGALAVPADIEGQDAIAVVKVPGWRAESVRTPGIAVDADDRRGGGLAPFEVMQGKIADPQGLADGLCQGVHRGRLS